MTKPNKYTKGANRLANKALAAGALSRAAYFAAFAKNVAITSSNAISFTQCIPMSSDSGALYLREFDNSFSIVNASENAWEVQKVFQSEDLINARLTDELQPVFTKVKAYLTFTCISQTPKLIVPFMARMADDATLSTVETPYLSVGNAIKASIQGACEIVYFPEIVPVTKWVQPHLSGGNLAYIYDTSLDLLAEISRAVPFQVKADNQGVTTFPYSLFGIAIRMQDNASVCSVHTRLLENYEQIKRRIHV
jgi:hypothetical protein